MRLAHVLIAKSIVETILVGFLAVFTFFTVFPPYFHGWGEVTTHGISGWAVNNRRPSERVEVQLFVDHRLVASGIANLSRPDVVAAGWARDEWHGYEFSVGALDGGIHEARVYAMHESGGGTRRSLQLLGDPISFSIGGNGILTDLSRVGR
jgi:hypothetical protein